MSWLSAAILDMRENPDGFPSSRVGFAEALLPFRYIDGTSPSV
jgi:hypothetical protein